MKLGIIRESKLPTDSRVCLTPEQCAHLIKRGFDITVQPSQERSFTDNEYLQLGIPMSEDMSDRDVLIGVKEVSIDDLIPHKTYFFFSHTIKKQPYNKTLLQKILENNIRLIDYEVITNEKGERLIAFGQFAGIVGAHNALFTFLKSKNVHNLPRLYQLHDYEAAKKIYQTLDIPKCNIVLTGTGRVASGAEIVLKDMGIKKVTPLSYLLESFDTPVFTQLNSFYYASRKDGKIFCSEQNFYDHPEDYKSEFHHFLTKTDIMINGIFWNNKAPAFFTLNDMLKDDFRLTTIADITCDIAPNSSVPSTLRPSTIEDPVFGFNKETGEEAEPYSRNAINMMTIDNLPNELPRDASIAFGEMFINHVIPELAKVNSGLLHRATITNNNGTLNAPFAYLSEYVNDH